MAGERATIVSRTALVSGWLVVSRSRFRSKPRLLSLVPATRPSGLAQMRMWMRVERSVSSTSGSGEEA